MRRVVAFLIIASVMTSCHEGQLPDNYVSAKRNNVDWVGTPEIQIDYATDTLTFLGIVNPMNSEVIVVKIKFNGTGSYSLTKDQGFFYSTIGGDVLSSEYKLAPNTIGQFVISEYDQTEGIIRGTFEMSLKKERSNPDNGIDFYNFTQGSFKGEIM